MKNAVFRHAPINSLLPIFAKKRLVNMSPINYTLYTGSVINGGGGGATPRHLDNLYPGFLYTRVEVTLKINQAFCHRKSIKVDHAHAPKVHCHNRELAFANFFYVFPAPIRMVPRVCY